MICPRGCRIIDNPSIGISFETNINQQLKQQNVKPYYVCPSCNYIFYIIEYAPTQVKTQ